MAVIVPSIGQLIWGDPLNNALIGLDSAIQGKANLGDLTSLAATVAGVQVQASNAQNTANNALAASSNVDGTIYVNSVAPVSPTSGDYWDNGKNLYRFNGSSWQPPNAITPVFTNQSSMPPLSNIITSTYVDFTSAQWAPVTVTIPISGMLKVTIGAAVRNTITATSTGWVTWRASGATTIPGNEKNGVSTAGSRNYGSRTVMLSGLTAGASITFTPQYNFSSKSASDTSVTGATDGQLLVEFVPV